MLAQAIPADPWSAFLDWLSSVLAPSWGGLVALLPYALVLFVIGPIVTLLFLAWAWHILRRPRGRVRRATVQAVAARRDEAGIAVFPPNVPYCEAHALIYPPRARACEIDHAVLMVACPVDGTVRAADIQVCSACDTRFSLGVGSASLEIAPTGRPPEGGAAVA